MEHEKVSNRRRARSNILAKTGALYRKTKQELQTPSRIRHTASKAFGSTRRPATLSAEAADRIKFELINSTRRLPDMRLNSEKEETICTKTLKK